MTYKVQKIFVNPRHALFKALDNYAFLSKNLYNSTLWRHTQDYKAGKKKISWAVLVKEFRATNQQDFRAIPSNMAALIVKAVDKEYKSCFAAKKAGLEARLPRYKDPIEGRYKLIFNERLISRKEIKRGYLKLTTPDSIKEELKFRLPKNIDYTTIKEVTVTKFNDGYMININYKVEDEVKVKQGNNVAAIDLGLSNLVACASNNEMKPFLISGCPINSFNHEWNKKVANLKSKLDTSNLGKRVKRGLFRASNGSEINADINGAYNILVKAIGKFNYRPIQVCGLPSTLKV